MNRIYQQDLCFHEDASVRSAGWRKELIEYSQLNNTRPRDITTKENRFFDVTSWYANTMKCMDILMTFYSHYLKNLVQFFLDTVSRHANPRVRAKAKLILEIASFKYNMAYD